MEHSFKLNFRPKTHFSTLFIMFNNCVLFVFLLQYVNQYFVCCLYLVKRWASVKWVTLSCEMVLVFSQFTITSITTFSDTTFLCCCLMACKRAWLIPSALENWIQSDNKSLQSVFTKSTVSGSEEKVRW